MAAQSGFRGPVVEQPAGQGASQGQGPDQAQIWVRDTTNAEKLVFLKAEEKRIENCGLRNPKTAVTNVVDDQGLTEDNERPFAHPFHWAAFSADNENRVALNLGGIANITWLPRTGGIASVILAAFFAGRAPRDQVA